MGKARKHHECAGTHVAPPSRRREHQGIRNDLSGRRQLPSGEQPLHNTAAVVAEKMNLTRRVVYFGGASLFTISDIKLDQARPFAA